MSQYKNGNPNPYIRKKALEFMRNFFINFDEPIEREVRIFDDIRRFGDGLFTPCQLHRMCRIVLGPIVYDPKRMKADDETVNDADDDLFPLRWQRRGFVKILQGLWENPPYRDKVRAIVTLHFRRSSRELARSPAEAGEVSARIMELQNSTGLSDVQREIVLLLWFMSQGFFSYTSDRYSRNGKLLERANFIAQHLDCSVAEVLEALAVEGKLRRYNMVDDSLDFNMGHGLSGFLSGLRSEPIVSAFYKKIEGELLPWIFYGELAEKHGGVLKRMIAGRPPERGLNILLYGEPGTGKTSFAQSLARELRLDCYNIAQTNGSNRGGEIDEIGFRFGALQVCADRVDDKRALLVVDEADKMLGAGCGWAAFFGKSQDEKGSKGILNTVLDKLKATVIWISNTSPDELATSSRRRFDYSICFGKLNTAQRRIVWKNAVNKHMLGTLFNSKTIDGLAEQHDISAGGISIVARNIASLAPPRHEAPKLAGQLIEQHCELMQIKCAGRAALSRNYSLDGLNIKGPVKLPQIVAAIRRFQKEKAGASPDAPRMNLLLSGPPGAGKTEFVKYLGRTLDTKVLTRMGSDLLSMWVGGTEQNIAKAFQEAAAENAILFLDEIDGLLQSRSAAQRSWEVTQVNELLHQMENFNGVLVGATNFIKNLDEAAARRFTFKLQFDWLDADGKRLFFERMFKTSLSEPQAARLTRIPNLAPGDFRTARQSLYYLGGETTNTARLDALERESEAKANNIFAEKRRIGFS